MFCWSMFLQKHESFLCIEYILVFDELDRFNRDTVKYTEDYMSILMFFFVFDYPQHNISAYFIFTMIHA